MSNKKLKCEEIGFEHAWEEVTPNVVYPTDPPQYPPRTEKCKNCGKVRKLITIQQVIKEEDDK
jgi:hypothetical protein